MAETEHSMAGRQLHECRQRLTDIDTALVALLFERDSVSEQVAAAKTILDEPSHNEIQEEIMIQRRRAMADAIGLDPDYAESVFRMIHDHSVEVQEGIRQQNDMLTPLQLEA